MIIFKYISFDWRSKSIETLKYKNKVKLNITSTREYKDGTKIEPKITLEESYTLLDINQHIEQLYILIECKLTYQAIKYVYWI